MVKQIAKEAISVSLTTDLWTSQNRKGFIKITCSYIDSDFIFKKVTFTVQYIYYSHTAKNIAKYIENVLQQWKIRNLTVTITTDNISNMKKCVKLLNRINWVNCFSHILQLVISKELFIV